MLAAQALSQHGGPRVSPIDLEQIKRAVREVRAASPTSALAELVEAKIRALESLEEERCNGDRRLFPVPKT